MNQDLVVRLNQAAINGIRASGAKQEINVEGNYWSGAWSWTNTSNNGGTNGATMGRLTDPLNKIVYQMHQYLDSDGSGTHEECVSSRVGEERLRAATSWLKQNKKVGIIGEFAAGNGTGCQEAIAGMLKYMQQNSDVWQGWLWWSAGPWWADYKYNMEPPTGRAWSQYLDLIMKYA
jgi:endoglucanase